MQELGYTFRNEEKTWPKKQSLSDFARRSCRPLAKSIISAYFDQLWPHFLALKQRVNKVVVSAQNELRQLQDNLVEYQRSFTTDDDFVR